MSNRSVTNVGVTLVLLNVVVSRWNLNLGDIERLARFRRTHVVFAIPVRFAAAG